jgi:hypothetical protein
MTRPAVVTLRTNGRWSLTAIYAAYGDTFEWMTPEQRKRHQAEHDQDVAALVRITGNRPA